MSTARSNVLQMYKNMLRVASKVEPATKRVETIESIRQEFRKSADVNSTETVEDLLKKANSSLGYLKMITPRQRTANSQQSGRTRLVFGEDGPREGKAVSNWTGSNMDPDSVKRHYNSLKRAGFTNNHSVVGDLF